MNELETYLRSVQNEMQMYKSLADKSMARVSDHDFFRQLDPESNSIALIVKHVAGNLRSRWQDFLTTDGEKPDRHRDAEFEITPADSRATLQEFWESGWQTALTALASLTVADLGRTVIIRREPHPVVVAINRNLAHSAHHAGQIVLLAKHFAAAQWESLSIPRGQSEQFNARMREQFKTT